MNDRIRISPIRLVDEKGTMVGEIATSTALQMAVDAGLDLVEVSADARPPVCRLMDYGKTEYERHKKQATGSKRRNQQLKQIRLRAKTGQHDIDFKVNQVRCFLARKDKVKINVVFRGRENAHHDRGRDLLLSIIETLTDVATVERPPSMDSGRSMSMTLIPKS
jgi:translation initiation factor IF-3